MKRLKFNNAAISLRLLVVAGFVAGLLAVTIAPRASNAVLMAVDSTADNPMVPVGPTQPLAAAGMVSDGAPEIAAQSVSAPTTLITFSSGSLIIPMDIASSGQNNGMLRAYGLVYELLRNDVPVSWVINPAKPVNGDDFTISLSNALQDVRTGATISPRSYRGGPFVIAASDAAAALLIIQAWQAEAGDNTAVHRFIGAGSFTVDVAKTLVRAPRIAILKDGNEAIAFNNLNAAGIPDSIGAIWGSASPDLLTEPEVEGVTTTNDADGILFHAGGQPRYCYLASMHYTTTSHTNEVVQEVRSWLGTSSSIHAFMQCEAARVFENATGGLFLTNAGLDDDGNATLSPLVRLPSNPLAQLDGTFEVDSGAVDSMRANDAPGSTPDYKTGVTTLINESFAPLTQRIVMLHGRLDGLTTTGQVTHLAGHDYSLDLPISANPQTNGVRLFLNSIFESDCASELGQDDVTLTKTAPSLTNTNEILYTISYANPGPGPVENLKLIDKLPAGTTYILSSGVPAPTSNSGGVLTWNLPGLASGAGATVTFKVTVTVDQTYANAAQMLFSNVAVRSIASNTVTTTRDTVSPSVTIIAGPTGATNDITPSFRFTTDATAVTKECGIDNANFTACSPDPAQYTSAPLADGPHTFNVRVRDAAGNTGQASRAFEVDTTPPIVTIPGPPINPTVTNDSTPTFVFTVSPGGSPTTTACQVDGGGFVPCTSPFTVVSPLSDGPHLLEVKATDAASNVGSASFVFTVDSTLVLVTIEVTPTNPTIPAGFSQQFTATGTFSNGSIRDLTDSVTWSSDNSAATISNASGSQGLATGVSPGMAQITAQSDAVSGSTTLTVTGAVLVAIHVSPTNPSVSEGHSLQFTATGTFSDGSNRDLTDSVSWSSSVHSVAQISNANGSEGVATGINAGTTQITAQSGSISGSTTLTVTPNPNPTLGNYPDTSIPLSADTMVTPDAPPTNTTNINVSTDTNFKGTFAASPTTGVVTVTDAHPAGSYPVTVTGFGPGGTTTKTFTLTVTSTPCGENFTSGFTNAADVNPGATPQSVAIGDFNGDGKQDLAVANFGSNTVSIRLGDGLGGFGGSTNVGVGVGPQSVAIGDFNGDGKQDFAVANGGSNTVSIRLGDGLGGFSGSTNVSVGSAPISVAIGDFNGDGKQDLAVANFSSTMVSISLGDGLGGFSGSTNVSVGLFPQSVAIGDFNGDGKQDLAVPKRPNTVSIRLGDGLGGFSTSPDVSVGVVPYSVAIGDFNGDGKQDLAVANYGSDTVSIRLGDGLGGFSGSTNVSVGILSISVAIGDFNGDGKQDLAVPNSDSDTVSIRLGDGLGGFSGSTNVSVGSVPYSVAIGDFNGDGKQDLAVVNYDSSTVSIRLGECIPGPTPTPFASVSGKVTYCPNSDPVSGVTMSLSGPSPAPSSTPTDGSGNYTLSSLTPGDTYTVTPSKAALPPGSAGIDTIDVIAAQRHYLTVAIIPPGCGRDAANVNGDNRIDTSDVVAIQRFFLGRPFGFANVGKYQFSPASRSYPNVASDQTGQDYVALVLGDIVAAFVHRPGGASRDAAGDDTSASEVPSTVAAVSLPNGAVDQSRSNFTGQVTTTTIDAENKLVGFQGDFTFDERVVTFQGEPVQKAGLTSGNWNVSGNVLPGAGPIRTLRISAFANDLTPLAGEGTLFELRMTRVSQAAQGAPLIWAASPNQFIFIDADLQTQKPGNAAPGSVTTATSSGGRGH